MNKLQKRIIDEMKVSPTINARKEILRRVEFLKDYLRNHISLRGFVLGVSGGQDSTLASKLAMIAIDSLNKEIGENKYKFVAVRLPYGLQRDEKDCSDAINFISPSETITINIKPAVDASVESLKNAGVILNDFLKGNEKARERMKVQYSIGGNENLIVIGTDHSAEAITGFFTKFGDGAADIAPLFGLNKRQGKLLLIELGCPPHLFEKIPTADLEDNQPGLPDEDALGITYDEIDDFLEGKTISKESEEKLINQYFKTEHKRSGVISLYNFIKKDF
jgi:NAD+ synthase